MDSFYVHGTLSLLSNTISRLSTEILQRSALFFFSPPSSIIIIYSTMETEEVPNNHGIIAAEDFNKNPFSFFECSPVGAYCVHPTCLEKNNSYIGNYTNPKV